MARSPQRQGIESRMGADGRERHRAYVRERGSGKLRRGPWRDALAEARGDRTKMLGANEAGTLGRHPGRAPTLRAVAESWLDDVDAGRARSGAGRPYAERTAVIYRQDFRLYILPKLGELPVDVIRRSHVQALVDEVAVLRSDQRARMVLGALGALYGHLARRYDDLTDPTFRVQRPSRPRPRQRVYLPAEVDAYVAAPAYAGDRAFIALCASGLRRSEAASIRVVDVNLARRALHVPRSKSEAGVRTLPIFAPLLPVLEAQLATLGPDPAPGQLVIPRRGRGGRHIGANREMDTTHALRRCREAWTAAGLDASLIPHELRHTFASLLVVAGYDPVTVAEWVGHGSPGTTLDVYAKPLRSRIDPGDVDAWLGELPPAFVSHGRSHGARRPH